MIVFLSQFVFIDDAIATNIEPLLP